MLLAATPTGWPAAAGAVPVPGGSSQNNGTPQYNVMAFGAAGDGRSHPAHTRFASLAALQTRYPFATALINEMDWLATQAAINACRAGGGGAVYTPAGTYVHSSAGSAKDGSGTLTLPETTPFFPNGQPVVNWFGDGAQATVHTWPASLGAGRFGVVSANRRDGRGNFGLVRGMSFLGPGPAYDKSRVAARDRTHMTGFGKGNAQDFEYCTFEQWDVGMDFLGGQDRMAACRFENNYYNMYWSAPNTAALVGDTMFDRLLLQNALGACVGVHHAACITDCLFNKVTFDYSPWGIFKETNGGAPANPQIMNFCNFTHTQFEAMGNGGIGDDRLTAGRPDPACATSIYQTRFIDTFFSWEKSLADPAFGAYAPFAANDWNLCVFDGGLATFLPGAAGVILIKNGGATGLRLIGDVTGLIAAIKAAPPASQYLVAGDSLAVVRLVDTGGLQWEGFAASATATTGLAAGQVCNLVPSTYGTVTVGSATAGAVTDAPAGVVMQVGGGNGRAGGVPFGVTIVVATRGVVSVDATGVFATGNFTAPVYLRTAAGGKVTPAANAADVTSPVVGLLAAAPRSATPGTVLIRLKGLD